MAGLDLGTGDFKKVTKICYFPRAGLPERLVGAKFQGSNSADFRNRVVTLHEVTSTPPNGWTVVTTIDSPQGFQFLRILLPNGGYNNVSEVAFYGDDAVKDPSAPTAPTALSASLVSGNAQSQIDLSWTDQSNNERQIQAASAIGWVDNGPGAVKGFRFSDQAEPKCQPTTA